MAKTANMGEVFRDLNRLSTLDNKEKYFVYVFDKEMKAYYDKILGRALHGVKSPMHVFDIPKGVDGVYTVDGNFDAEVKNYSEFNKSAFSSFDRSYHSFVWFNYQIEVKEAQQIENTDYYLIVVQVL